eukprot:3710099-Ditylum_brightwellii.AAC.1
MFHGICQQTSNSSDISGVVQTDVCYVILRKKHRIISLSANLQWQCSGGKKCYKNCQNYYYGAKQTHNGGTLQWIVLSRMDKNIRYAFMGKGFVDTKKQQNTVDSANY